MTQNGDVSDTQPLGYTDEVPPWGTPPRASGQRAPRLDAEPGFERGFERGFEPGFEPGFERGFEVGFEPGFHAEPRYPSSSEDLEPSEAVIAFVVGLVGLFVFPPVAPIAWFMGRRELRAVHRGRRDPRKRVLAQIAVVLGIIGTVVFAVGTVLLSVVIVLLVVAFT